MTDKNYIGNGSTIIKFIITTLSGWLLAQLAAHGLNLPIDAQTLAEVLGAIIGFIFAYIDAKYPNTFKWLGNDKPPMEVEAEEPVLNDEYEVDEDGC